MSTAHRCRWQSRLLVRLYKVLVSGQTRDQKEDIVSLDGGFEPSSPILDSTMIALSRVAKETCRISIEVDSK